MSRGDFRGTIREENNLFPSLAVAAALHSRGATIASVLTLGYRGELCLEDAARSLSRLAQAGVLWSPAARRGAILLPNLCRDDGYDLHLVNVNLADAQALLAPDGVLAACCQGSMPGLYF